jgi:uncharacterized membrane protein
MLESKTPESHGIGEFRAIEIMYLTLITGGGNLEQFCGVSGDCGSVLSGPYSWIPGTEIPLAAVGLVAYTTIAALALGPIIQNQSDDADNRVQLTALSTAMGVFSVFLMGLLFGVLKESCAFCIASATFSLLLFNLAWFGDVLPKERFKEGVAWSAGSALQPLRPLLSWCRCRPCGHCWSANCETTFCGGW